MEGLGPRGFQVAILLAARGVEKFNADMKNAFVISEAAAGGLGLIDEQLRAISNAATKGFSEGFFRGFAGTFGEVGDKLVSINAAMLTLGERTGSVAKGAIALLDRITRFAQDHPVAFDFLFNPLPTTIFGGGGKPPEFKLPELKPPLEGGLPGGSPFAPEDEETAIARQERLAEAKRRLAEATRLANQTEQEGKALMESLRTPMEEYAAQLENIAMLHQKKAISAETAARAEQQALTTVVGTYVDGAAQITSTLAGAFQDNKAFAIANAVMNVAQGIASALSLPFPLNWAQVAAVTAAGFAQIAKIKSTNPGSGAAPTRPSAGGGKGAAVARSAGGNGSTSSGAPAQSQAVNITIQGDNFSGAGMRRFIDELNAAIGDGARLNVT